MPEANQRSPPPEPHLPSHCRRRCADGGGIRRRFEPGNQTTERTGTNTTPPLDAQFLSQADLFCRGRLPGIHGRTSPDRVDHATAVRRRHGEGGDPRLVSGCKIRNAGGDSRCIKSGIRTWNRTGLLARANLPAARTSERSAALFPGVIGKALHPADHDGRLYMGEEARHGSRLCRSLCKNPPAHAGSGCSPFCDPGILSSAELTASFRLALIPVI